MDPKDEGKVYTYDSTVNPTWTFDNCLNVEYENTDKSIHGALFDISRYGKYNKTMYFDENVTQYEAIKTIEIWLSKPLTEKYYDKICDDTFHKHSWEKTKEYYKCRGDCLSDARFLEMAEIENGILKLCCGS